MIYKDTFELRGTETQIAIVKAALDRIFFPWDKLTPPKGKFIIGWANLNGQALEGGKLHGGDHPAKDSDTEPIMGSINGKKYTLGVFYPSSGNIYIDNVLVDYVKYAETTVSAEIAHLVDFFLPLTSGMKQAIGELMHGGVDKDHGHSWWEKIDYGTEYFSLMGEGFMQAFTIAYSDVSFDASEFVHSIKPDQTDELRRIIGIERTDFVFVDPNPVVEPEPAPTGDDSETHYEVFPRSKVYHRIDHYDKRDGKYTTDVTGLRPCKICKP